MATNRFFSIIFTHLVKDIITVFIYFSCVLAPIVILSQPLAGNQSKFVGNVIRDGNNIRADFSQYWNQVTPENAGKWANVESSRDQYNWTQLDHIYQFALDHQYPYRHHVLIWGSQYPSWITSLSEEEQRGEVEEWIQLIGERYPQMDYVEVVNEPFNAPAPFSEALGGSGETGWDWVITAFEWARQYCDPGVKLLLNEYNVLHDNSITSNFLSIVNLLKERDLIDGICIQGHYFEFKSAIGMTPSYSYSVTTIGANLNRLGETGLPIYLAEFDINEADDAVQLQNYQTYFPLFYENPAVKGITLWGYVQNEIWKTDGYLITSRRKERPALEWLRTYLSSPIRPILISPIGTTNESVNPVLIWHSSYGATSYQVQVSTSSAFSVLIMDTAITDTTLQLSNLQGATRYYWHVNAVGESGISEYTVTKNFKTMEINTAVGEISKEISGFLLEQNYPNPFNPTTQIDYSVPESGRISLKVYSLLGEEIAVLCEGFQPAGHYSATFNGSGLPGGVYIYQLMVGNSVETRKLILLN